jgi:TPP-dependent pyruvate/acetoin dehydrogenase alpha subunit
MTELTSKKFLTDLYRTMLRIRLCEEALVEPIINKEVRCPCHLYSGEEAVAAGICAALRKEDYVFSSHRSHGHYLAKGGSMAEMMAEIFGKQTGCSRGRGGSMHLIDPEHGVLGSAPIVAGTIPLALGAALAASIQKNGRVTVSFFGDGATGEGVLYESLNFAALKKLPLIFACENNLYSTHMPIRECRVDTEIRLIGRPFGIECHAVDGNDVLRVHEAARNAVKTCRGGHGPVFLEFKTYRLRGHVGPDDFIQGTRTDIRPKEEIERWKKRDPLDRFERFLLRRNLAGRENLLHIREDVAREVAHALAFARKSPYPKKGDLAQYVFHK